MTERPLLDRLQQACEQGLLRRLDVALAQFIGAGLPRDAEPLLLATALLSRVESLGHGCLDLESLREDPAKVLAWPSESLTLLQPELVALSSAIGQPESLRLGTHQRVGLADEGDPQTPLVLDGQRLYLRRYWAMERRVVAQLTQRARPWSVDVVLMDRAQTCLDSVFGPASAQHAQRLACERALHAGFTLVTGGPGTGKTYTAARLLAVLRLLHTGSQPLRVGLAAPTGKAAARLRASIDEGLQALLQLPGIDPGFSHDGTFLVSGTLHALLGVQQGTRRFRHDARRPLAFDVLLVDEASMVHLELFDALLQALPPTSRLVLLGDSEQLASVEAGSVVGDLCAAPAHSDVARQTVRLTETRRFAGAIGAAARAVNAGDAVELLRLLGSPSDGSLRRVVLTSLRPSVGRTPEASDVAAWSLSNPDPEGLHTHAHWLAHLRQRPPSPLAFEGWAKALIERFNAFRVLCALRDGARGVSGINEATEREAQTRGWLQRRGAWYEGRPVMVVRNDPGLGLFNGDTGLVLRAPGSARADEGDLRAWFLTVKGLRSVAVSRLPEVETAFAMTVHKSQGSEFDHVLLVLPDEDLALLTRELIYTGMTRARRRLSLAYRSEEALVDAVARRTWRMSGLRF